MARAHVRARRVVVAVAVALGIAVGAAAAPAEPRTPTKPTTPGAAEIRVLEAEVAARPDDVDLRLRLALALAWNDRREDARREARLVIAQAPDYADAELLLARLAAWDGDWGEARAYLARALATRPTDADALLLAADIALWSGDLDAAREAVAALPLAGVGEVERLYRQAQLAVAERDNRVARRLARRILAIDPAHAGARNLTRSVFYASVESATELEVYPSAYPERLATAETVSVSIFPGARWSATMIYEYRRRFATNNQRFALRGDWRVTDRIALLGYVRAGVVEVVPLATALAELRFQQRGWIAGVRYGYDRMPWPGELHRAQAIAGAPLGRGVRVDAEGFVGVLRACGDLRAVWGGRGRLAWSGRRWDLGAGGGYGLEVDRGTTAALVPDPCVGTSRDFIDLDAAAGGLDVERRFGSRWSARIGYGLELRPAEIRVHLASLAVRAWF